jgi:superfamily II DNA or RNA helicase
MPTLYPHQQELINKNPKKHLLAWGTGTGKTLTAITLAKNNNVDSLVICPKSLVNQWNEQVPDGWLVLSKEQFKKRHREIKNYNCIIFDEFHYAGNHKSQITKALISYVKNYNVEFIYGLTATPYLSSIWNIYSYGIIFGKNWSWYSWSEKYFVKIKMGHRSIPIAKSVIDGNPLEKEVSTLVNNLGSTVSLNDCFYVPDQIFQVEKFDLTSEQKKAIKDNWDILPIVNYTRVAQICGGSLLGDGYTDDKFFKSEKLDRVLDLIKEHKKLIVVCHFNNEIDVISSKVKNKKIYIIRGDVKNRHEVVKQAESNDNCVVLINGACSEGYELPSFPIMVFYSYDFSLKNYIQILGRIQRAGHIKKNVYISLVVKNTIDEDIYTSVAVKKMDFQLQIYAKAQN